MREAMCEQVRREDRDALHVVKQTEVCAKIRIMKWIS